MHHEQHTVRPTDPVPGNLPHFQSSGKKPSTVNHTVSTFTLKMVAHISAVLLPCIIIYYAIAEFNLFSWHPTLMVIGCSLLMLEGIVIFSKNSTLFPSMARTTKASIHYWLAGIGVSCVLAGLAAIYFFKERMGKNHYTTWHGLFGVITAGYLCVQSFGGVTLKYHKYLSGVVKVKLVDLKLYHATSGLMAFLLVTITILLALQSNWVSAHIPWYLWWVCMACASGGALTVMNHVTSTYLPVAMKKPQAGR